PCPCRKTFQRGASAARRGCFLRGNLEFSDDRCVVRGALPGSRSSIYVTAVTHGRQRCGAQQQVDAQPQVAAEREHPVIPPAEAALRLLEAAEQVGQAE